MIITEYHKEYKTEYETAVTIGKFDGIHLGHQKLISSVVEKKSEGLKSVVIAFYDKTHQRKNILTEEESIELLKSYGVDELFLLPYSEEIFQMEAEDFIKNVLVRQLHAKFIACGIDFSFGKDRVGNVLLLENLKEKYGYTLQVFEKEKVNNLEVSSSRIRKSMEVGDIEDVNLCLSHPYEITGEIVHGKRLGRKLGFPTINVLPKENKILPKFGVYYTKVTIDGVIYGGLANLGMKPSVTDEKIILLETHLLDTSGDFYGKEAKCILMSFIRPEMKFESIDELMKRVLSDIEEAKKRHKDS